MPEVGDPTPSKHDSVTAERSSDVFGKRIGREVVVLSRGREPPKAGLITGVKS